MTVFEILMKFCPKPRDHKNDSELAQAYRNWYYGIRSEYSCYDPNKEMDPPEKEGEHG